MLLSESKKFLFIHIQKTAGRSFEAVLRANIPDIKQFMGTHDHASWAKEQIGSDWDNYYKVALVRNPWDRMVSWYTMIQEKAKSRSKWYKRFTGLGKFNRIYQYVLSNSNSFEEFLNNCVDIIDDYDGRKSFIYNQLDYITDNNESLIVDFVGRFEHLKRDTDIVFKNLGLENVTIPHINTSDHKHYCSYYTEKTKQLVAERFTRDIKFFGYEF